MFRQLKKKPASSYLKINDTICAWQQGSSKIPEEYMKLSPKKKQSKSDKDNFKNKHYPSTSSLLYQKWHHKNKHNSKSKSFFLHNNIKYHSQQQQILILEQTHGKIHSQSQSNLNNRSLFLRSKTHQTLSKPTSIQRKKDRLESRSNKEAIDNELSLSYTLNSWIHKSSVNIVNERGQPSTRDNPWKNQVKQEKQEYDMKKLIRTKGNAFLEKIFSLSQENKKVQTNENENKQGKEKINKNGVQNWQFQRKIFLRTNVKFKNWKNSSKKMLCSNLLLHPRNQ